MGLEEEIYMSIQIAKLSTKRSFKIEFEKQPSTAHKQYPRQ